jgi:hypothetical protein
MFVSTVVRFFLTCAIPFQSIPIRINKAVSRLIVSLLRIVVRLLVSSLRIKVVCRFLSPHVSVFSLWMCYMFCWLKLVYGNKQLLIVVRLLVSSLGIKICVDFWVHTCPSFSFECVIYFVGWNSVVETNNIYFRHIRFRVDRLLNSLCPSVSLSACRDGATDRTLERNFMKLNIVKF